MLWQASTVIPAIDVLEGRCVRLSEGGASASRSRAETRRRRRPRFAGEGADAAPPRRPRRRVLGPPDAGLVERVGGGRCAGAGRRRAARRSKPIEAALDAGAARAMVGTAALGPGVASPRRSRPLRRAAGRRRRRQDGRVVADGWVTETDVAAAANSRGACAEAGVRRLLVTSTRRDGSLRRPRPRAARRGARRPECRCSPPAGSRRSTTSRALRDLGCEGAVVGSALWSGRFG